MYALTHGSLSSNAADGQAAEGNGLQGTECGAHQQKGTSSESANRAVHNQPFKKLPLVTPIGVVSRDNMYKGTRKFCKIAVTAAAAGAQEATDVGIELLLTSRAMMYAARILWWL